MIGFALVMRHPRSRFHRLTSFMPERDIRQALKGARHRQGRARLFVVKASLEGSVARTKAYNRAEEWLAGKPMREAVHGCMVRTTWRHDERPQTRRLL